MKTIAGSFLKIGEQWHITPLSFNRQISTSASLYARGIRGVLRSMNISDKEAEHLTPEEFEDLTNPDLGDFKGHAANIEKDAAKFQNFIQQKTIKQKYFKQYEPREENLLTWAMKEQLKYLHATDPDEWTPEALSAAFPISAVGVEKLLKAKWIPENEAAIERHDKAVLARWRMYTNGQLGSVRLLEETLKKRLSKGNENLPIPCMDQSEVMSTLESLQFENYESPNTPKPNNKRTNIRKGPKVRSGSFVSIIEDYEAQIFKNKQSDEAYQSKEMRHATPGHVNAAVIVSGTPEYEGRYSQISSEAPIRNSKRNGKTVNNKKLMTFDEFMKRKSVS